MCFLSNLKLSFAQGDNFPTLFWGTNVPGSLVPQFFWGTWEHVPVVPMNLGELFTNLGEYIPQLTGFKVSVVNT